MDSLHLAICMLILWGDQPSFRSCIIFYDAVVGRVERVWWQEIAGNIHIQ